MRQTHDQATVLCVTFEMNAIGDFLAVGRTAGKISLRPRPERDALPSPPAAG